MREKGIFLKVLLVIGSLMFSFIIGEIFLRIVWHNPYRRELPDKMLKIQMHHPNTYHIYDRSAIGEKCPSLLRTDERGYILPSFVFKNPDFTVAFLGGSTTECSTVQEELRFHALVGKYLEKHYKVNTLNAARSAGSIHDSINVLLNHVINDKPDIVCLMHACNDIGLLKEESGYKVRMGEYVTFTSLIKWTIQKLSHIYWIGLIRKSYSGPSIINHSQIRRAQNIKASVPTNPFYQRLKLFIEICKTFDIIPVLMTQPSINITNELTPKWFQSTNQIVFNNIIRKVGKEKDVMVIDLSLYIEEKIKEYKDPQKFFFDGLHVTDFGSQQYALYITERFFSLMQNSKKLKRNVNDYP